jgi:hypothetical protein
VLTHAQEFARDETVANRARPELDALGVRSGSFKIFPVLAGGGIYNSNIYADDVNVFSDTIFVVSPGIDFESDWNNHAVRVGAAADAYRYTDFDSENRTDYAVYGEGRLDMSSSRFILGEISHARQHEDRFSADDVRGFNPTRFYRNDISVSYEAPRGPRRFHTELIAEYRDLDFENAFGAGGVINNDDRDRHRVTGTARVGYGFHPEYSVFLQGSAHTVDYEQEFDDGGFNRNSNGYEVALGTTLDFSGEAFGDIFVGYLSEKYDDPRFQAVSGPSFGIEVFWNVSGLTTLSVLGRREVEPTTIGESGGTDNTRFGVGVDHELLRNMIVSLDLNTEKEDFIGIARRDDNRFANLSIRYIMNRRAELTFEYQYRQRDSEPSPNTGIEFSRNLVALTLKGQL